MRSAFDALFGYQRLIYFAAFILAFAFGSTYLLEHGNWTRTEEFRGPFESSPNDPSQYRIAIGVDIPFLKIPGPCHKRQRAFHANQTFQVRINGRVYAPPFGFEPLIDQGKLFGIRGIYRHLQFTLPSWAPNNSSTVLDVTYSVKPQGTAYDVIRMLFLLTLVLAAIVAYTSGKFARLRAHRIWTRLDPGLASDEPLNAKIRSGKFLASIGLVLVPIGFRFLIFPVVWNQIDAATAVLWPLGMIPHYPFGYMLLSFFVKQIVGISSVYEFLMVGIQASLFAFCFLYFICAFQSLRTRAIMTLLISTQLSALLIVGGIYTESIGYCGMLVLAGVLVRAANRPLSTRTFLMYLTGLVVCASARWPFVVFGLGLPVVLWLNIVAGRKNQGARTKALFVTIIFTAIFFILPQINRAICYEVGNASCELPTGEAGIELAATILSEMNEKAKEQKIEELKAATRDPIERALIDIIGNPAMPRSWLPIQEEIRHRVLENKDLGAIARLKRPGELDRVMTSAYFLFLRKAYRDVAAHALRAAKSYYYFDQLEYAVETRGSVIFARPADLILQINYQSIRLYSGSPYHLDVFFSNPTTRKEADEIRRSKIVSVADVFFGPTTIIPLVALIVVLGSAVWAFRRSACPLKLTSAFMVVDVCYVIGMSLSVGVVLERYKITGSFWLALFIISLAGIFFDSILLRIKPAAPVVDG